MTCREAQNMIRDYIAGKLSPRELERFIGHIRDCGSCYDELETFFMIDRTVKYLDDGLDHSFNLKYLLEKDLREKEKALIWRRRKHIFWAVLLTAAAALIALAALDVLGIFRVTQLF